MENIFLVFGSNGQLGRRLVETLRLRENSKVIELPRSKCDLASDPNEILKNLDEISIEFRIRESTLKGRVFILLSAAMTHVDRCEIEKNLCWRINVENTVGIFQYALNYWSSKSHSPKVVFFSSDYVFDGKSGMYKEDAVTNPLNEYGRSKKYVEEWLQRNASSRLIIRTTGVYDFIPGSKNFVMQTYQSLKNNSGSKIRVAGDQFYTPTWAKSLAEATSSLLNSDANDIYHVAGDSPWLNRAEIARQIAEKMGEDPNRIESLSSRSLSFLAERPMLGGLCTKRFRELSGWVPENLQTVLMNWGGFGV